MNSTLVFLKALHLQDTLHTAVRIAPKLKLANRPQRRGTLRCPSSLRPEVYTGRREQANQWQTGCLHCKTSCHVNITAGYELKTSVPFPRLWQMDGSEDNVMPYWSEKSEPPSPGLPPPPVSPFQPYVRSVTSLGHVLVSPHQWSGLSKLPHTHSHTPSQILQHHTRSSALKGGWRERVFPEYEGCLLRLTGTSDCCGAFMIWFDPQRGLVAVVLNCFRLWTPKT